MTLLALAVSLALSSAPKLSQKTQLKIEVKPSNTVVYVDGKKRGTGAKPVTLTTTPGRHMIKLVFGRDEHQEVISVKKGESKTWTWAFEDDRPKTPARGERAATEEAANSDAAPEAAPPAQPNSAVDADPVFDGPPAD